jgi:PKD repeat protein
MKMEFRRWDISTEKNPAYTYSKEGKYTVTLTAKNEAGSNKKLCLIMYWLKIYKNELKKEKDQNISK